MMKPANDPVKIQRLANEIGKRNSADILVYWGALHADCDLLLGEKVAKGKRAPNAILFLVTNGGFADVAYKIARCLQRTYAGRLTVAVGSICKSAGTLIALGADELVVWDSGELGPLDVQIYKKDEVGEWMSGLTPTQALATLRTEVFNAFEYHFLRLRERSGFQISTQTAAKMASELVIGCFSSVYGQIDPMRLGEQQRAMLIAHQYATRLQRPGALLKDAIDKLIGGYPSHEFVVDHAEAQNLFARVRKPTASEQALYKLLALVGNEPHSVPPYVDYLSDLNKTVPKVIKNAQDKRAQPNLREIRARARTNRRKALGGNGSAV